MFALVTTTEDHIRFYRTCAFCDFAAARVRVRFLILGVNVPITPSVSVEIELPLPNKLIRIIRQIA